MPGVPAGNRGMRDSPKLIVDWTIGLDSHYKQLFTRLKLCSKPQNVEAGGIWVGGTKVRLPINFEESMPPNTTSPSTTKSAVVRGESETLVMLLLMIFCFSIWSVTVGMRVNGLSPVVLKVRSWGPIPKIPSTPDGRKKNWGYVNRESLNVVNSQPSKPKDVRAEPNCWLWMTISLSPITMVSMTGI